MNRTLLACLSALGLSCSEAGHTYFIDETLTREQRLIAHDVAAAWNYRVGVNGTRNDVTPDINEADTIITTRSYEWLNPTGKTTTGGTFAQMYGKRTIVVRADFEPQLFRRVLDHEFGHSLGLFSHLPEGQPGLMSSDASDPWSTYDAAHCKASKVCD